MRKFSMHFCAAALGACVLAISTFYATTQEKVDQDPATGAPPPHRIKDRILHPLMINPSTGELVDQSGDNSDLQPFNTPEEKRKRIEHFNAIQHPIAPGDTLGKTPEQIASDQRSIWDITHPIMPGTSSDPEIQKAEAQTRADMDESIRSQRKIQTNP